MTKIAKTLCLLAAVGLWQGCSSSSDDKDGSTKDGAVDGGGGDASGVFLSRGTNEYTVTSVTAVQDGCDTGVADPTDGLLNANLPVTFTVANNVGTLEVGNKSGVPLSPSLGSGTVGVEGTLMRTNDTTIPGGTCTWHTVLSADFTLTGGDEFKLVVTEDQSAFTAGCAAPTPTCTSTYTLTFAKAAATTTDGGTGN